MLTDPRREGLSYRSAGVDIEAGEAAVELIKREVESTYIPGVISSLGGFAALYEVPQGLERPVLVTATDGVGTKLLLAQEMGRLDTVGVDLVAMSVNDVLTVGARPVLFLDYVAVGKLLPGEVARVVAGVAEGCRQAGCALVGGEMAEMPGLYEPGEFDLAGFCVGLGERDRLLDGSQVTEGDVVLGLASSGFHSNGYSLVRRVLSVSGHNLREKFPTSGVTAGLLEAPGCTLGEALLTPTRIYVKSVLGLLAEGIPVRAMAHITGGGIGGNLARVIPAGFVARLRLDEWQVPALFRVIQDWGSISEQEMFATFNMGVGYVLVVPGDAAEVVTARLRAAGEIVMRLGEIIPAIAEGPGGTKRPTGTEDVGEGKVILEGVL